jgi:hypothetical protein
METSGRSRLQVAPLANRNANKERESERVFETKELPFSVINRPGPETAPAQESSNIAASGKTP